MTQLQTSLRHRPTRRQTALIILLAFTLPMVPLHATAQIKVDVRGGSNELQKNIELHLSRWDKLPSDDIADIESSLQADVQKALRALGYYQATAKYSLDGERLLIELTPGRPVVWGETSITARRQGAGTDGQLQTLIDAQPFTKGATINHKTYEDYKKRIINYAIDNGYLDAKLTQSQLVIDAENYQAKVNLELDLGERYTIADAQYSGSEARLNLIEMIAEVPKGEWYSVNTVGAVYNRLLNSGYFSNVAVNVKKQADAQVLLDIELTERPSSLISVGVGFATDEEGPRFRLKWAMPRVNQRGDSMTAQTKVSQVEQDVSFAYNIPWDHPQNEYISLTAGWQHKVTDTLETGQATTGAAYNRILNNGWQYSVGVDYNNETSRLGEQEESSFTYVLPNFNVSKRSFSGDPADPDRGYKYWLSFGASNEAIGSDTNFYRVNLGVNLVKRFAEKHDFLTRMEWGQIIADDFLRVPPSLRFFTGGDQTVRGYKYESISPLDPEGNVIGGNELIVGSVEYQYKILKQWKLAVFVDAGRVTYDELNQLEATPEQQTSWDAELGSADEFYLGAGVGVRWKTPIGAISLDVATPIDQDDLSPRIHFYFGTSL